MNKNPRIVLAGSVNSTHTTLLKLIEHEMNLVGVFGLSSEKKCRVSGFRDLGPVCHRHGIPFWEFLNVNNPDIVELIRSLQPDLLFVVGLSQLVRDELLAVPANGVIGYHPTKLPEGRGRGAIAWLAMGKAPPAASFFQIDEGMDSGPIWFQKPYTVEASDYAQDVIDKVVQAIGVGLDEALPELKAGKLPLQPQDHAKASYLGVRRPEDGYIDWNRPADDIAQLVRAVSRPLPGAYTYLNTQKLIVYRATVSTIDNHVGVPGRLVLADETNGYVVQTGSGLLNLEDIEGTDWDQLRPGVKLGLNVETELIRLIRDQKGT